MKPHVFLQLCNVLQYTYRLRHTRHIRLEESVGMCLMILGQGACNKLVQERSQHSSKTIYKHSHRVLKRLNIMLMDIFKPSNLTFSVVSRHIQKNTLYMPHFQVCISIYIICLSLLGLFSKLLKFVFYFRIILVPLMVHISKLLFQRTRKLHIIIKRVC